MCIWHVANDGFISGLDHWRWHSVAPDNSDAASILKMCQPSWQDVKSRIAELKEDIEATKARIEGIEYPEFQQMEQDIENGEFNVPRRITTCKYRAYAKALNQQRELKANLEGFSKSENTHLGHVFAGSGMYWVRSSATTDGDERPSIRD